MTVKRINALLALATKATPSQATIRLIIKYTAPRQPEHSAAPPISTPIIYDRLAADVSGGSGREAHRSQSRVGDGKRVSNSDQTRCHAVHDALRRVKSDAALGRPREARVAGTLDAQRPVEALPELRRKEGVYNGIHARVGVGEYVRRDF